MPNRSGVWNLNTVLQAKNATNWPTRPDAPTGVSATAGDQEATVSFTPPSFQGIPDTIIDYRATSTPEGITATASSSPITVTGLTNDTSYTFTVAARNELGYGAESSPSGSVTPQAALAVFAGGFDSSFNRLNTIDYMSISSLGNASDFGDLTIGRTYPTGCASSSRGLFGGGEGASITNVIDFVTFASTGDASDFGDLTNTLASTAGCNSSTRGVFAGGYSSYPTGTLGISYVTIASTGNAVSFGNLTANTWGAAGFSSPTRGIFAGSYNTSNVIQYITIASTGNATDFGDLLEATRASAGCSNSTRGLVAGNSGTFSNTISYVTISSTGNSINFGDLSFNLQNAPAGAASSTRAVFGGGSQSGFTTVNIVQYVTISSTGNGQDFGDLTTARAILGACSSANGGLA